MGERPWALVTGSAVRVGREILLAFARKGFDVVLHYRSSESAAHKTEKEARAVGAEVLTVESDLATPKGRAHLAERIEKSDVPLQHVVLSAAIFHPTPFGSVKEEQWDELMDVNLKAPFFTAQHLAPLIRGGGALTFIGDVSGDDPWPSFIPYCTTKAGIHALTRGLAKALAPSVRVNAVAPGAVLAPKSYGEEEKRDAVKRALIKRWGTPADIAAAVVYLDGATYATGSVLPVDGGRHLG